MSSLLQRRRGLAKAYQGRDGYGLGPPAHKTSAARQRLNFGIVIDRKQRRGNSTAEWNSAPVCSADCVRDDAEKFRFRSDRVPIGIDIQPCDIPMPFDCCGCKQLNGLVFVA